MDTLHTSWRYLISAFFYAALMCGGNSLFAQVKVGTNPTAIGANSNLEIEALNNKKVIVHKDNGTVVIENTPAGMVTDSLLTVDPSGNVRAISPVRLQPPAASMERTSNQDLTTGVLSVVDFISSSVDDLGSVDLAGNEIVIKQAGIYTLASTIKVLIPGSAGRANVDVFIQKFNGTTWDPIAANQSEQQATATLTLTVSTTGKFVVGNRFRVMVIACNNCIAGNPPFPLSSATFFAGGH